jgi:diguanylate cyclase (GGDEF)-like protein
VRALADRSDVLGRMGGDEFVVICAGDGAAARAADLAAQIVPACADALVVRDGREIRCTVSAGTAVARDGADAPQDLLRRADEAMYAVKRAGRPAPAVPTGGP